MSRGVGHRANDALPPEPDPIGAALALAAQAHAGQRRTDGSPYLAHPLRVCELLANAGEPPATLAAALLHDAVEDSDLTVGEVVERFGTDVGELVAALTDDERIDDWHERKDALREQVAAAGPAAAAIYAADKLANLEELHVLYEREGEAVSGRMKAPTLEARVEAWRRDLAVVAELAPPGDLVEGLRRELAAFERLRAGGRPGVGSGARG